MVDNQIDGGKRVDLGRIAAQDVHGVTHGRQIDHGGNAGEVLHQHAGRAVGDFMVRFAGVEPFGHRLHVIDRNRAAVFTAQQVFQQYLQGKRQPPDGADAGRFRGFQREIIVFLAADRKGAAGFKGILAGDGHMGNLRLALAHDFAHAGLSTNPPSVYSYGAPRARSTRKRITRHAHARAEGKSAPLIRNPLR